MGGRAGIRNRDAGLARYSLVYGSMGTVVALMFWLYLSAWITFFGAHLAAAVADHTERAADVKTGGSGEPMAVQADGEIVGETPVRIGVLPQALQVIVRLSRA